MLGTVFPHHIRQLVVHVLLNPESGFLLLWRLFTNDLRPDRPSGREGLHDGLGLELNGTLHQHGMKHTTGSGPRLSPVFMLQAQ